MYLDTDFLGTLLKQLGTQSSTAAEAYIMAHEYGHHAQDLLGTLSKAHASGDQTEPKSASVRLELQADCYADAYLKWTSQNRDDVIDNVTCDNLTKVVEAARAVGDDHIQHQSSGSVQPVNGLMAPRICASTGRSAVSILAIRPSATPFPRAI